jgi:hypothetical protein
MKRRLVITAGGTAVVLALAACGSGTSASSNNSSSNGNSANRSGNGDGPGGFARRGAAGTLAQINGTSLILSATDGTDVTVDYTNSTTITQTRTGLLADVVPGSCLIATGTKDASGTLVASNVRLSQPVNGSCTVAGFGNRPPGANGSPNPNATPRAVPRRTPPPGQPLPAFATGKVTAVNGTSVTLQPATGATQTITVPTTVTVSESNVASASALAVGDCIQATGGRDSSGTVNATALSIVPAGPSGCFTGGRGGFGGFGGFGGGRGFGGGGAGGGAAGGATGA